MRTLHLLRKETAHFPESPMFVAAIGFGRFKGLPAARERTLEILRAIIDLPGAYLVVDERRSPVVRAGIKKCGRAATKIYDRADG